ncbi:hypothetical protein RIF29_14814 [Crotalaria pallida]|uniref:Uncharacterized protein n=1 Tax=Crotalaria pallida TaxID=3830 RepID=A0AAN9FG57_CROPI
MDKEPLKLGPAILPMYSSPPSLSRELSLFSLDFPKTRPHFSLFLRLSLTQNQNHKTSPPPTPLLRELQPPLPLFILPSHSRRCSALHHRKAATITPSFLSIHPELRHHEGFSPVPPAGVAIETRYNRLYPIVACHLIRSGTKSRLDF